MRPISRVAIELPDRPARGVYSCRGQQGLRDRAGTCRLPMVIKRRLPYRRWKRRVRSAIRFDRMFWRVSRTDARWRMHLAELVALADVASRRPSDEFDIGAHRKR